MGYNEWYIGQKHTLLGAKCIFALMPRYNPAQLDFLSKYKDQHKDKYPSVPDYARPKAKLPGTDANSLTQAIIKFIDMSGGWATRISTEGRYIESLGKRIPSSVKKGTADIHAVYKGRHLSIEVKIDKDKQSEVQKSVQEQIEKAGGLYYIAKDFTSFHHWITQL